RERSGSCLAPSARSGCGTAKIGLNLSRRSRWSETGSIETPAQALEERAAHHARRRRDSIEKLERQLALIHQHPGPVSHAPSKRYRRAQKGGGLRRVDEIVEETSA